MKLTKVLFRQHLNRMFIQQWLVQSKRKVIDKKIPEELKEKGINVKSAESILYPHQEITFRVPEALRKELKVEDDPNYHQRICHSYNRDICLLEGLEQASILTKTIINKGLTSQHEEFFQQATHDIENSSNGDIDEHVKRIIQQARAWDAWQRKLPIIKLEKYGYERRHYGLPAHRQNQTMWEGLLHLSNLLTSHHPKALDRSIISNAHAKGYYEKDGDLILSSIKANFMLASSSALKNFAGKGEVSATVDQSLPDIFPLKHTIDLRQENLYVLENRTTLPLNAIHSNIHTVVFSHTAEKSFSQSQIDANGVCNCFTFALAKAKEKYGDDIQGALPEPINIQGIQAAHNEVSFISYQLNTLDLNGVDGIKNIAWLDSANSVCSECNEFEVTDYNPDVIRKLLAFYLNDLN